MSTEWIEMFKKRHESDHNKSYTWTQVKGLFDYIDQRELLIDDLREQRDNLKKEINK